MNVDTVAEAFREGIWVVVKVSGPMLLLSMVVGIFLALFQAVTQIHEQTLQFIFKVVIVGGVLLIGGGWMMENLLEYARKLFQLMLMGG